MKTQYISVFNGMRDGIGMQLLLKNIFGRFVSAYRAIYLCIVAFSSKIGVPVKPNN